MFISFSSVIVFPVIANVLVSLLNKFRIKTIETLPLIIVVSNILNNMIVYFLTSNIVTTLTHKRSIVVLVSAIVSLLTATVIEKVIYRATQRNNTISVYRLYLSVFFTLSIFILIYILWLQKSMGVINYEILMFNLMNPVNTNSANFITDVINFTLISLVSSIAFVVFLYKSSVIKPIRRKDQTKVSIKIALTLVPIVIFSLILLFSYKTLDVENLLYYLSQPDEPFIQNNYVEADESNVVFPKKKRNLITIFVESYESTYFDKENGGARDYNLMPRATEYLENGAINFSHLPNKYGGMINIPGATWSIAGMTAQLSGVPYKVQGDSTEYGKSSKFLPGIKSVGDLLHQNGYQTRILLGSDANDYAVRSFYEGHGDYLVVDRPYALEREWLYKDYWVWWGFEDKKLYQFSKEALLEMSQEPEPFHLIIETTDTHFADGYTDKSCATNYDKPYANSIACADKQLGEFLDWAKQQDFYDNTTFFITGDHLSMDGAYFEDISDFERTTFNMIVNPDPSIPSEFNRQNRLFSAVDMYPTMLRSIGVNIIGNKLGLGTDLFSGTNTLFEDYSVDFVQKKLELRSEFYSDKFILGKNVE